MKNKSVALVETCTKPLLALHWQRGEEHSTSLCTNNTQNHPRPIVRQSSTSLTRLVLAFSVWSTEDFTTNQARPGQGQCWMQFDL